MSNRFILSDIDYAHGDVYHFYLSYVSIDIYVIFKYGLTEYFIKYVESGHIDPSADDNYAIRWAADRVHLDVVKYLCELPSVDPSADNNYAIRWAAANGHLGVVKYLCELPSVDPSADDNFAIRLAAERGHLDVAKYLLSIDDVRSKLSQKDLDKYELMIKI